METPSAARVLVVEDSATILQYVETVMSRGGLEVVTATDGAAAVERFHEQRPDIVVLDVNLPRMDGWAVLERMRSVDENVPVIMLTAIDDEPSKVRGLMGGADDYVVKPVGPGELMARVRALLRRRRFGAGASADSVFDDGRLHVDFNRRTAAVGGQEVALTPLEFRLLAAFVRHAGETLSPRELMELVWNDYTGVTTDPVKVYVGYLRKKLASVGGADLIETVRGYGYRYQVPAAA